jgi:hypothetical protein
MAASPQIVCSVDQVNERHFAVRQPNADSRRESLGPTDASRRAKAGVPLRLPSSCDAGLLQVELALDSAAGFIGNPAITQPLVDEFPLRRDQLRPQLCRDQSNIDLA